MEAIKGIKAVKRTHFIAFNAATNHSSKIAVTFASEKIKKRSQLLTINYYLGGCPMMVDDGG